MREILFRGKKIDNGEWAYGYLSNSRDVKRKLSYCIDYEEKEVMCSSIVFPETVGQYTGLTDKNGTKIFEGDIVNDNTSGLYGKVVYATPQDGYDGLAGFMVDDVYDGLQNYNGFWHLVDMIGNIHDNPELLEGIEK